MSATIVDVRTTAPSLDGLLTRLAELAALPAERATALPPAAYFSPELYELEVERIFRREWMCVARVDQLAEPGSWLSIDLVGEPIVLTRDDEGVVRALSRVCRHRSMDLMSHEPDVCGTARRLTCPYHLWSYRLDGTLAGAPEMGEAEGFDTSVCSLPEFPVEIWQGFVFVNLDPAAEPLAPRLEPVGAKYAPYDLGDWTVAGVDRWGEQPVSWKVVIENGSECYHHMGTHKTTLQQLWPGQSIVPEGAHDDDFFAVPMVVAPSMSVGTSPDGRPIQPTYLPVPEHASTLQRSSTFVVGTFPMFFFALSPDFATWFRWFPTGPESHVVDIFILVPPGSEQADGFDEIVDGIRAAVHEIQAEDVKTNTAVMRGLHASNAPAGGRLSHLERPIWQLQRYLAGRLGLVGSS